MDLPILLMSLSSCIQRETRDYQVSASRKSSLPLDSYCLEEVYQNIPKIGSMESDWAQVSLTPATIVSSAFLLGSLLGIVLFHGRVEQEKYPAETFPWERMPFVNTQDPLLNCLVAPTPLNCLRLSRNILRGDYKEHELERMGRRLENTQRGFHCGRRQNLRCRAYGIVKKSLERAFDKF